MTDRHQQKPYPLRMPDELREKLEAAAKGGARSLHAEIVARLQASFTAGATANPFDDPNVKATLHALDNLRVLQAKLLQAVLDVVDEAHTDDADVRLARLLATGINDQDERSMRKAFEMIGFPVTGQST